MTNRKPIHIKSVSEYHRLYNLPAPEHPLISIVKYADLDRVFEENTPVVFGHYTISLKRGVSKMFYGQQII
ncbi:hypothetical protein GCM10023231_12940 [Olivibacter ginsenosidimutans]|uniref:AraC family transcriptional regulator n=1 Tax=Olivibacter ginsenosidimutans TaxID=1176537 RepID=A0ABP9AVT6_9SPHI